VTIDIDIGLDLDSLLEESIDIQKARREQKSAKKASNKGAVLPKTAAWMTGPEVTQHYADVAKIKQSAEGWKPVAAILLIHSQVCTTCYAEHQRVEGIFIKKENLRLRAVSYLQPKDSLELANLPKEIEIRPIRTSICPTCYDGQGWRDIPITLKE
jgi:hypothetical protein